MDREARRQVAHTLAQAWIVRRPIERLPPELRPATDDEAHDIQDAMIEAIGQPIGGWKVGAKRPIRGARFASGIVSTPAAVPGSDQHLRAIEGEVAFVFPYGLAPQANEYSRLEVAAAVQACAAIEIVDSRYRDFPDVSEPEKLADLLSNGGLVQGPTVRDWQHLDFSTIGVELVIDGHTVLQRQGGHATGDPLNACLLFVNAMRMRGGVPAGSVVTTGTYTGMPRLESGSTAIVRFTGLGEAQLTFTI